MRSRHFVLSGALMLGACGGATTSEKSDKDPAQGCIVGTTYLAADGCNTCQCTANGSACTEKACGKSSGDGGTACIVDGRTYTEGNHVPSVDGCNSCVCVSGAVACTTIGCSTDAGAAATCTGLQNAASAHFEKYVETNRACIVDTDCVAIGANSDCFDSCTRAIAASASSLVTQWRDEVNAAECVQFKARGCTRISPPCDAPLGVHCVDKLCQ